MRHGIVESEDFTLHSSCVGAQESAGDCLCGPEVRSRLTVRSSWESVFRITKEASRLLTALTFFYIVEPDFLQQSPDLNHLNCKIGKCQDGISDTLDMNDFEPVIHTPSIEQKGKSRRHLRENPVQAKEIKTSKSSPALYLQCLFITVFALPLA